MIRARQSALCAIIALHLAALAYGKDEYFWPLPIYGMFSHLQNIKKQKIYSVLAENESGKELDYQALADLFYPYPSVVAVTLMMEHKPWPLVCGYLKDRLIQSPQISRLRIGVRENYKAQEKFMFLDRHGPC